MSDKATQHNNSIVEKLGNQEFDNCIRRCRDLFDFAIDDFSFSRFCEALSNPYVYGKATIMYIKEEVTKAKGIEYNDTTTLDQNCTNEQAISIAQERFDSGNKVDVYADHKDENDIIRKGFVDNGDGTYSVEKETIKGFIIKVISNSTIPKAGDETNPIYHAVPDHNDLTQALNFLLDNRHQPSDDDYTEILTKIEYFNTRPECLVVMKIIGEILMTRYPPAIVNHLKSCNFVIDKEYRCSA